MADRSLPPSERDHAPLLADHPAFRPRSDRQSIVDLEYHEKKLLCYALHSPVLRTLNGLPKDGQSSKDLAIQLKRAGAEERQSIISLPEILRYRGHLNNNKDNQAVNNKPTHQNQSSLSRMMSFMIPSKASTAPPASHPDRKSRLCPTHAPICHHLLRGLLKIIQREVGRKTDETIASFSGKNKDGTTHTHIIRHKYPVIDNFIRELRRINSYWTRLDDYRKIYQDDLGEKAYLYRYVENECDGCIISSIVAVEENLINLRTMACLRKRSGKKHKTPTFSGESNEYPEIVTWAETWMGKSERMSRQEMIEISNQLVHLIKKCKKAEKKEHKKAEKKTEKKTKRRKETEGTTTSSISEVPPSPAPSRDTPSDPFGNNPGLEGDVSDGSYESDYIETDPDDLEIQIGYQPGPRSSRVGTSSSNATNTTTTTDTTATTNSDNNPFADSHRYDSYQLPPHPEDWENEIFAAYQHASTQFGESPYKCRPSYQEYFNEQTKKEQDEQEVHALIAEMLKGFGRYQSGIPPSPPDAEKDGSCMRY